MTKRRRITLGGYACHVLNRANGPLHIFRKAGDFLAFERVLAEALDRVPMRRCGYCPMSNHWHLLLWPRGDGDSNRPSVRVAAREKQPFERRPKTGRLVTVTTYRVALRVLMRPR